MQVLIFSDNKITGKPFAKIDKNRDHTLHFFPLADLKKVIKNTEHGSLVYVDITDVPEADLKKTLKYLSKMENNYYGIIDRENTIKDVADLFHNNASDYIGKELCKEEISPKRLTSIENFRNIQLPYPDDTKKGETPYILSGKDWSSVRVGREYTFCMMFIELDNQKELKKNMGATHIDQAVMSFRKYLEKALEPINGQIWMWMDFGGLILFPFDGDNCDAILASFRLILNRHIICMENTIFNTTISYRIAIHLGNTVYRKKGDTGTIISDSINSIFHLGHKYTFPGNFCITREVFEFAPAGLKRMFLDAGEFEGRQILRMRLPE